MKLGSNMLRRRLRVFLMLFCALLAVLYRLSGSPEIFIEGAAFGFFLLWAAIFDFFYGLIFDRLLVFMAASGAFLRLFFTGQPMDAFFGALAGGAALGILRAVSGGGIGGGDIKLAAAIGIWLGWEKTSLTLLIAFWLGGAAALFLLLAGMKERGGFLAFGPFLSAAAMIAFLYGEAILALYWEYVYG